MGLWDTLTQIGSDVAGLPRKIVNSFGYEPELNETARRYLTSPTQAAGADLADAYSRLPTASPADISRQIQGRIPGAGKSYVNPADVTETGSGSAPASARNSLTATGGVDETAFQRWYGDWAKKSGMNPNPDDPSHFYDYRAAFQAGITPPEPGGHWPSQFKREGHPNEIVNGVNTRTGQPVDPRSRFLSSLSQENPRLGYFAANNPRFWEAHGQAINEAGGDINKLRNVVDRWNTWINGPSGNQAQEPAARSTTTGTRARQLLNPGDTTFGTPTVPVENIAGTNTDTRTFALTNPEFVGFDRSQAGGERLRAINPNNAEDLADWNSRAALTGGTGWNRVNELTPAEQRIKSSLDMASNELGQFTRLKPEDKAKLLVQAMGPAMTAGGHVGGAELTKEGHVAAAETAGRYGLMGHEVTARASMANNQLSNKTELEKARILLNAKDNPEDKGLRDLQKGFILEDQKNDQGILRDVLATKEQKDAAEARIKERREAISGRTAAPAKPAAKPTWDQFYAEASKAPQNKGKTRQQLLDYYNQNYR